MASTKREMARLRKAVEAASACPHSDGCPVLYKLRVNPEIDFGAVADNLGDRNPGHYSDNNKADRWEIIPESKVEIAVSVDSLLKLPEGAAYTKRSGQANIKVATHGDTVYITGTCDSLQRQVEYYEALYHTARDALEQQHEQYQQERKQRTSPRL